MKILIVGGGIAGLSLASFLQESNVSCDIIEQAPDWSRAGFLISLWDSGRDMLKKLGLEEKFDATGEPVHAYSIRDGAGYVLRQIDLSNLYAEYGGAATILSRADLHAWLLEKVGADKVRMNTSIQSIAQTDRSASVTFSDGATGEYDLIVGADGMHSKVRSLVFQDAVESYDDWRVWYAWVESKFGSPGIVYEYVAPREFTIICTAKGRTTAWFLAPASHATRDGVKGRAARLAALMKDETAFDPQIFANLKDEDLMPSDLMCVRLRSWSRGRAVLLGDAAHSMGPHAGIGATLAMEDAYVLAAQLMQVSLLYPLSKTLSQHERDRRPRVARASHMSTPLKHMTLVESRPLRKVLNAVMGRVPSRFLFRDLKPLLAQEI